MNQVFEPERRNKIWVDDITYIPTKGHFVSCSVYRKGNPYDNNAVMESFYKLIKRELIHNAHYEFPEQAQNEIFKYIELYSI